MENNRNIAADATMNEKIYFECPRTKVTNLRFYCNGNTYPLYRIESVCINHRVWRMFSALMAFLFSFITLIYGAAGLLFVATAFIWIFHEYVNYTELWIREGGELKKVDSCISPTRNAFTASRMPSTRP